MISSEENSGLFTFMVGLIVLVMAAVGLSLLMDRRFQFSSGVSELRHEVKLGDTEISELKNKNEYLNQSLAESGTRRLSESQTYKELASQSESRGRRQADLVKTRDELLSVVTVLEGKFSAYRASYRRETWAAAVGENLGNLTLRSGRTYQQVSIRRVTDVGLEIQHADGIARVQGPELDAKFQERFQWDDEERRLRLKEESENFDNHGNDKTPGGGTEVVTTQSESAREANKARNAERNLKRAAQRQNVRNWKSKVRQLTSEQAEAVSRSTYGSKSVPGSLETWQNKAARLSGDLAKARAALAAAKADLSAISPSDTLLAQDDEL